MKVVCWRDRAVSPILVLVSLLLGSTFSFAGTGRFSPETGKFNFIVSIQFSASDTQLTIIRQRFAQADTIFYNATRGRHQFGRIVICNNFLGTNYADILIVPTPSADCGRSNSTLAGFGILPGGKIPIFKGTAVRGLNRIRLYMNRFFDWKRGQFTIAHEFAHLVYGVQDEYEGPDGFFSGTEKVRCLPDPPDGATLSACLMDDYYTRPGLGSEELFCPRLSAVEHPTLVDFCDATNHDTTQQNFQQIRNMQSCWQTISEQTRFPLGLAKGTAPDAIDFPAVSGERRIVLILDRSGSMLPEFDDGGEDRLGAAKIATAEFLDNLPDRDIFGNIYKFGVVSFNHSVSSDFCLAPVNEENISAAKEAIADLDGGGGTAMGAGIETALTMLPSDSACPEIFVLLTDGKHITGIHPNDLIAQLRGRGVVVFTVGIGADVDESILQALADTTGGMYFPVTISDPAIPATSLR